MTPDPPTDRTRHEGAWLVVVACAGALGLGLMADSLHRSSATYDEVAYLRIAAEWWRTGRQEAITRMGSPLLFWKLQQAPVLWALDRTGRGAWVDDPIGHQRELLPIVRAWSLGAWLIAFGITAAWSRRLYGPRSMALAAVLFALSPDLLAHGPLATMEMPLTAAATAMFVLFWQFLRSGDRRAFWACAGAGGIAFSCKFTAVVLPPILAVAWWLDLIRRGGVGPWRAGLRVGRGMVGFALVMALADFAATGFATIPLSPRTGTHPTIEGRLHGRPGRVVARLIETPIPRDWVGFATQMRHQRSGGPSYLLGERRMSGWRHYYLVALAVKTPLAFWLLLGSAIAIRLRGEVDPKARDALLPTAILLFLAIASAGSSRNYGVRYLLPLAPLAIVWVSALAESRRWARASGWLGACGYALAIASVHPHELSYFNALAGGSAGGHRVLADSNLDWGQGAKALARLQRLRPEFRDLTTYYFGDTDPSHYGVVGRCLVIDAGEVHPGLPPALSAETEYLAVSTSLQYGPWGPPGYFRDLDGLRPSAVLDDRTISIYRTADLNQ